MTKATPDQLQEALRNAVAALRHLQVGEGSWCGILEGDSILESEYLLMKFILSQEDEPMVDGRGREVLDRIAGGLRSQQREDGSWGQYPGSGIDISATVKGYFALKLMGDDPDAPHMKSAREQVLANGGRNAATVSATSTSPASARSPGMRFHRFPRRSSCCHAGSTSTCRRSAHGPGP